MGQGLLVKAEGITYAQIREAGCSKSNLHVNELSSVPKRTPSRFALLTVLLKLATRVCPCVRTFFSSGLVLAGLDRASQARRDAHREAFFVAIRRFPSGPSVTLHSEPTPNLGFFHYHNFSCDLLLLQAGRPL